MSPLVAGLLGGTFAVGVLLIVLGVQGVPAGGARRRLAPGVDRPPASGARHRRGRPRVRRDGWPVGALAGRGVRMVGANLIGAKAAASGRSTASKAMGGQRLRDTMAAMAGLHEAIGVWRGWHLAIRAAVEELATGLQSERLPVLLRPLRRAPTRGDQVAVAHFCRLNGTGHGWPACSTAVCAAAVPRLASACDRGAAGEAASQARLVSGVIASVVAIYVVLNRSYLAPFGAARPGRAFAAVCGLWFLSFWALVRLASVEPGSPPGGGPVIPALVMGMVAGSGLWLMARGWWPARRRSVRPSSRSAGQAERRRATNPPSPCAARPCVPWPSPSRRPPPGVSAADLALIGRTAEEQAVDKLQTAPVRRRAPRRAGDLDDRDTAADRSGRAGVVALRARRMVPGRRTGRLASAAAHAVPRRAWPPTSGSSRSSSPVVPRSRRRCRMPPATAPAGASPCCVEP